MRALASPGYGTTPHPSLGDGPCREGSGSWRRSPPSGRPARLPTTAIPIFFLNHLNLSFPKTTAEFIISYSTCCPFLLCWFVPGSPQHHSSIPPLGTQSSRAGVPNR